MGIPDPTADPQFYQGVPLRRFMAFLIDSVVIAGLWIVGAIAFSVITLGFGTVLIGPLLFFIAFLYRWLLLAKRSATLGMQATGIEVRDEAGNHLTSGQAAIHTAGFMLTIAFLPLAIIGWILMASSPERRAMHDLPLSTVVINKPA
ncbi:MAG: RDD family protein [Pseudomonadota bacterium]